jgi:thioredoxin 1
MADDAKYLNLNAENFEAEVMQSDVPVLVDFWAAWCGPCRIMNPIIDELAETFAGKAKIAKVNVDQEESLALKFNVMAIPSLIFFNQGEVVERIEGVSDKDNLAKKLTTLVG